MKISSQTAKSERCLLSNIIGDKKLLLLLPLLLVISISGCTDFCIPGLTCTVIEKHEADIFVFQQISAIPTTISPGQTARVTAYVKNTIENGMTVNEITMYDNCEGVFGEATASCDECKDIYVYGKQTIHVTWTMTASDAIKLKTACEPKVKLSYTKTTHSWTSVSFVTPDELRRRLQEGLSEPVKSEIEVGPGPIRAYFAVEDQQPIATDAGTIVVSLHIKNEGRGYLKENYIKTDTLDVYVGTENPGPSASLNTDELMDSLTLSLRACKGDTEAAGKIGRQINNPWGQEINDDNENKINVIEIIGKQEVKLLCAITIDKTLFKERDEVKLYFSVELRDYEYEIRSKTKITVEPKILE